MLLLTLKGISSAQTLEESVQTAAENNPELKAYLNDYLAAMEQVPQVGALPDPELTIGFFLQPMDRFIGRQQADVRLMQMFPWFGMLRIRKDEASKMAMARYEAFQDTKNRLFYQVKRTWYDLYRLEEEINIARENLDILKTYERLALTRFQNAGVGAGAGSPGMRDVLRVRIEIRDMENTLARLRDSRIPLQTEFNQLLHRDLNHAVALTDTLAPADLSVRLALLDSMTQGNAMQKEAELKQQAVQARKENTAGQLAVQWATALRDLDDATQRTDLYRGQATLVQQTLNLLMTAYSTSGQDFEEVLRLQQQLLDYKLKLITAVLDQHTAVAMLEMLSGDDLMI